MKENVTRLSSIVAKLGFSAKAARLYVAALELGEATVQDLARHSGVERTTAYYTLNELRDAGAIFETKRNKKIYYLPEEPRSLLRIARTRLSEVEERLEDLEEHRNSVHKRPRVHFLYGVSGFKHVWDMIFRSGDGEYRIITEGENFLQFVKERYILDEIIKTKKRLAIRSRQIIKDSPYARSIVAKDAQENRESRILSSRHKIPFTEIISSEFVAFVSPRWSDTIFIVENEEFAMSRKAIFESLWERLDAKPDTKIG